MSDTTQAILMTQIPLTIAALATFVIGWRNSRKVDTTIKQNEVLISKTEEIHTLTNSNLARITRQYEVAMMEIEGMKKLIAEMINSRNESTAVKDAATRYVHDAAAAQEHRDKFKDVG